MSFGRNLIGFGPEQQERLQVAKAQAALSKLGFDVGKIDGKLGPKTTKAVTMFQKKQHMKADGKISEKLLEQLKTATERLPMADPSQPNRATGQ